MDQTVDRRLNPTGKNFGNAQRYFRRVRGHIEEAARRAIGTQTVSGKAGAKGGFDVTVPQKDTNQPVFGHSPTGGRRDIVHAGNEKHLKGDRIKRPAGGAGGGAGGSGEGDDTEFRYAWTNFFDTVLDGLELPRRIKTENPESFDQRVKSRGYVPDPNTSRIHVVRTAKQALMRRIAQRRPSLSTFVAAAAEVMRLEALDQPDADAVEQARQVLDRIQQRRKKFSFIDPIDVRRRNLITEKIPKDRLVLICLMDVSASMEQKEREAALYHFFLLKNFIERQNDGKEAEVIFVRHTTTAQEVDEKTFFAGSQSGGTLVSSGLEMVLDIIQKRCPPSTANVYVGQVSDGDNAGYDNPKSVELVKKLLGLCRAFSYLEVKKKENDLGLAYRMGLGGYEGFIMDRVEDSGGVLAAFRRMFAPKAARPVPTAKPAKVAAFHHP